MMPDAIREDAAQRARAAYAAFQQQDYAAIDSLFATTGRWYEPPHIMGLDRTGGAALHPGHPAGAALDAAQTPTQETATRRASAD